MTDLQHVCIPSSSLFRFLIIFICTMAQNLLPSLCDTENRYLNCVAPFHCPNTTLNLSYPFWGSTRPSYCGNPRFELNCSGEAPVLSIMSTSYRVIEINYDSQSLRVARMDYWNDVCPAYAANSTIDFSLFNYTDDTDGLILFYDCPTSITTSEISLSRASTSSSCNVSSTGGNGSESGNARYSKCSSHATFNITTNETISNNSAWRNQFSCPNRDYLASYYELKSTTNSSSWRGLWGCNTSVILPIMQSAAEIIGDDSTPTNLVAALRAGFGLRWHLDNATCEKCEASGGACGSSPGTDEFTCYCKTGSYPSECGKASSSESPRWIRVVIGSLASLMAISVMVVLVYYRKKRMLSKQVEEIIRTYAAQLIPKRYSYAEVKRMTKLFKEKIGRGGYSIVYKGKLPNGQDVAVKLLNKSKGDMKEFMNEVACISKTSHVNVVTLLGFCLEWNKRVLIYELMPKGSLDKYICNGGPLNKDCQLDWNTLYKIVLGIARGLEYLHRGCNTKILHFDIKPHNILLDEDFCPKISDFGLSKQCKIKESHVSMTNPRGTPGFMAPEVFFRNLTKVTYKSDVYSFGMLILEMLGERKNSNEDLSQNSEEYFPDWIYNDLQQSKDTNTYWATMTEEEEEIVRKMIIVSLRCIQTIPSDRPSMSEVIEMLGRSLDRLQIPPRPSLRL